MPTNVMLGTALSIGVTTVALGLTVWQWFDGRHRPAKLMAKDHEYFQSQEVRRWGVSGLMLALGVLLFLGTHVPAQSQRRPNLLFVETWAAVLGVVVVLLVLAFKDWGATRRYARRQRHEMAREGMAILRDEMRRRAALRSLEQHEEPGGDLANDEDWLPDA